MLSKDDFQRLGRLLNNLHLLTGIKFSLMDEWGNELYASSFKAPFCGLIMQEDSGFERCHACDGRRPRRWDARRCGANTSAMRGCMRWPCL